MAKQVIRRQGSASEHQVFTGAEGEWTHDNTLNTGRFHDGVQSGGYPALLSNNINELSSTTNLDGSSFGELIIADSTSGSFTITLPDPSTLGFGWQVAIKKSVDANSVTVEPFGGESIDGDSSVVLENAENAIQVRTDGTQWYSLRLNNFDDAQEILYDNTSSGLSATTVQGAIDDLADFSINDANDVNTSGVTDGQALAYNSTTGDWEPTTIAADSITEGNSSVEVIDSGSGRIEFTTDGSERMRIDSSGFISLAGNTDTGWDFPQANQQRWLCGGAETFRTYQIAAAYGVLRVNGSGSATYPNFTFNGDDNTGMYRATTDSLAFTTGGTERMRLDSSGNLKFNSGYGSVATAYGCRAWVNFDGTGTVNIRESGNVSSITDQGTGDYEVNFATSMPDANYASVTTSDGTSESFMRLSTTQTSYVRVNNYETENNRNNDTSIIHLAVFR